MHTLLSKVSMNQEPVDTLLMYDHASLPQLLDGSLGFTTRHVSLHPVGGE
jgi:hypothetical protein